MQVMLALHDGRFAEAEVLLARSLELGLRSQETMAEAGHALQLYELRREQGRAHEAAGPLARAAAENPTRPLFGFALSLHPETYLVRHTGMTTVESRAAAMLARLADDRVVRRLRRERKRS